MIHATASPMPPEHFLSALDAFMQERAVSWKQLERVVVVVGPGSFTSTRVIVTIANGIAFAQTIPVLGVENPTHAPLQTLIENSVWQNIESPDTFASPVYDRPPNITMRKK